MRIGILHGYELTGSGSNEYNRYLSRALADAGHEVHLFCREPRPATIDHASKAIAWGFDGESELLFERETGAECVLHVLPHASVRPVFLTDKQRPGNVQSFCDLSDAELHEYHTQTVAVLRHVLALHPVDVLHANHLVWQPQVAAEVAADLGMPFVVFPHGSAIEYTVREDPRYLAAAREALLACDGLVSGSREVLRRILDLYPEHADVLRAKSEIVGVGVDTSLFEPVERERRAVSIAQLDGDWRGKSAAQRAALAERLSAGDFEAVCDYRDAYEHGQPDADLLARLEDLPWQDGKVLLFVGALTAGKGLQSLIAALPAVLEPHPTAHLVVVGSGAYREVLEGLVHAITTADEALFGWLVQRGFDLDRSNLSGAWQDVGTAMPRRCDLAGHVHFVGRLQHEQLRFLFPCADLAVFPSIVPEAYPLVLMEALSNGVFPVVSDFSGFRDGLDALEQLVGKDVVEPMRLPVGPARTAGIASRLNALLSGRPADQPRLREIATRHYDWSVRARELVVAWEAILERTHDAV